MQTIIQLIIALGIFNVWLVRYRKPSQWRGGNAQNLQEEFAIYGLSERFMKVIGILKLLLAVLLVVGIWIAPLTKPAAAGIALLMLGAVVMHIKVNDPLRKSLPALSLLVLSLILVFV